MFFRYFPEASTICQYNLVDIESVFEKNFYKIDGMFTSIKNNNQVKIVIELKYF